MSRVFWLIVTGLLLAVSIVLGVQHFAAKHGGDQAALDQAVKATESAEKVLAKVDTVFKRDTVKLTHEVAKYRVLHDSTRITDTVWVKQFVQQADSTIKACFDVVNTCAKKDSAHVAIEQGLRRQNEALRSLVPSKTERFLSATKWLAIGAVVGVAFQHR